MIQSSLSSLSTNPLFTSIITLDTIALLYFPSFFIQIIFSPVFIFSFIILLYLLRLGASQRSALKLQQGKAQASNPAEPISEYLSPREIVVAESNTPKEIIIAELDSAQLIPEDLGSAEKISGDLNSAELIFDQLKSAETVAELNSADFRGEYLGSAEANHEDLDYAEPNYESFKSSANISEDLNFVEWDVRAPLEVIYEANEGEEEGQNDDVLVGVRDTQMSIIEKYASLSMYYPETDSDNSSSEMDFPVTGESKSPENVGFQWDEEDVEGLIEIELDGKMMKTEVEEDNLIEIDLSPMR